MTFAIILFIVTYVLMFVFPKKRPWIALISAAVFIVSGMLPYQDVLSSINWNVLMMICGTMGTVGLMIESRMPARLADMLIEKVPNVKWAVFILSIFAGLISAFIDNVATVLMVAPIALEIAKKQKINPVGMIIAIAVSSNLQGAATLVGDTTSIMLGGYANMNFLDFFVYHHRPGMFFITEIGAACSALVLLFLFRNEKQPVHVSERTPVSDYVPTILLLGTVLALIIASLIPNTPEMVNGIICMSIMLIGTIYHMIRQHSFKAVKDVAASIDYETLLLLLGLFLVVAGIRHMGVIDAIAKFFSKLGGGSLFAIYTIVVWFSVLFSAFIDNIPYVATMLPVMQGIAASLGVDPTPLYFGLLVGATLGGNLTPVGASANITAIGILRKNGYEVTNKDFFRIGIPFTLSAVIPAYLLVWAFFGA